MSRRAASMLRPRDRLGKYEIIREIGVGGMAELYLARARGIEGFEKLVAVKRIFPELAREESFVDMFLDEARLAARLSHPNVVSVYDIGEDPRGYFFAMEYLHGKDVGRLIKDAAAQGKGLTLGCALAIVIAAAAGLHHAHESRDDRGELLGLVHRDVSPTNLIVTYDGIVKVVDFGIAKALTRRTRTTTGLIKGKIAYLSPEQCRGDEVDRRTDVFALGVVLFELTTGTRLYGKLDDFAIMHRLATGELPLPSSRRESYPEELERIVVTCMASDPAERYPTARALADALEAFARERALDVSSRALMELVRSVQGEVPPIVGGELPPLEPTASTVVERADAKDATRGSLSKNVSSAPSRSKLRVVAYAAIAAAGVTGGVLYSRLAGNPASNASGEAAATGSAAPSLLVSSASSASVERQGSSVATSAVELPAASVPSVASSPSALPEHAASATLPKVSAAREGLAPTKPRSSSKAPAASAPPSAPAARPKNDELL